LLFSGCGRDKVSEEASGPEVKIGFALADLQQEESKIMKQTVEARAGKDKVAAQWADAGNDPAQQKRDILRLVRQGAKVIVWQPVDPSAGPEIAKVLGENNVRLITIGSLPQNTPADGYVGPDYRRAGQMQAGFVLNHLIRPTAAGKEATAGDNKKKEQPEVKYRVLVLCGSGEDMAGKALCQGIQEKFQSHSEIEVTVKEHPRNDLKLAAAAVQQYLAAHGKVDVIMAESGPLAAEAIKVLKEHKLTSKVMTVGVGVEKQCFSALISGEHDAEIDDLPEVTARNAYQAAVSLAREDSWNYHSSLDNGAYDVPVRITPVRLIHKENIYLVRQRWQDILKVSKEEEPAKPEFKVPPPEEDKEETDTEQ